MAHRASCLIAGLLLLAVAVSFRPASAGLVEQVSKAGQEAASPLAAKGLLWLAEAPASSQSQPDGVHRPETTSTETAFLKAVRAEVRDGTIWVWLKNSGNGALSRRHYRQGSLEVRISSARKSIPLRLIDPEKRLAASERIVSFDTGLGLNKSDSVAFEFRNVPGQQTRTFFLRPVPVLGQEQRTPTSKPAAQRAPPRDTSRPAPSKAKSSGTPGSASAASTEEACNVKVSMTSRGSRFAPGQHLQLGWRLVGQTGNSPHVTIRLISAQAGGYSRQVASLRPKRPHFVWRIPDDVPSGEYRLYVGLGTTGEESGLHGCYGTSRPFSITGPAGDGPGRNAERPSRQRPASRVEVLSPREGETYFLQDDLLVEWRSSSCESFKVSVLKDDKAVFEAGPASHCGRELQKRIKDSFRRFVSGNDYQVRVEHFQGPPGDTPQGEQAILRGSDTTGYFTLVNNWQPPDGGACNQDMPLKLLYPSWPDLSFAPGERLEIRWCFEPARAPRSNLSIELVRDSLNGGGRWLVDDEVPASAGSSTWAVPSEPPPGDGYRIRLEAPGLGEVSVSNYPFMITPE